MSRWFRHYAGMMRDDKLVRVAIRSGQPIERVVWVYGAILESASEVNQDGAYDVDAAEIAYFLRADVSDINLVFSNLETAGHVVEGRVVKWSDRQFKSDSSADRQAAYRERKRGQNAHNEQAAPSGDAQVTSPSRHSDAPELETETETEVSEAKASSPREWVLPLGVSLQIWTDFLANRKRKRLGNTPTAWKAFQDDLRRVSSQTGIPPPKLIEHAAAKGWGSINAPDEDNRNGSHIGSLRGPRPDPTLALVRAAAAAQREDRGDHGEARLALPSGKLG